MACTSQKAYTQPSQHPPAFEKLPYKRYFFPKKLIRIFIMRTVTYHL